MYTTILVPLDGSKRAEAILPHVAELARRYGAKVIFLRIEVDPVVLGHDFVIDMSIYEQARDLSRKESESYLDGLVGEFKKNNITAKQIVFSGAVVQSILNTAEKEGADLIAMASHGRSGLARVFYGSVAAGILQRVDRPLLIIRSRGIE